MKSFSSVRERSWPRELLVGAAAGVVATVASGLTDKLLSTAVSAEQKRRDARVRDGSPHDVAGPRFAARLLGHEPSPRARRISKAAFSLSYGVVWGLAYGALRRVQPRAHTKALLPLEAVAFFLACDGVIAPLLRLTPGLSKIPWQMNAKEAANHAAWTLVAEGLHRADERLVAAGR